MALSHQYGAAAVKSASDMAAELHGLPAVKVAGDKPSGKAKKALDRVEEVQAEKREPKKPLSKKKALVGARVSEDVISALKSAEGNYASHVEAAMMEYAVRNGWL